MQRLTRLLAAVLTFSLAHNVFAWNGETHQLVVWIKEERLSAKAQTGVKELLGNAALSDAEVVSWADEVRRERRETAPWHYMNIPIDPDGYDPMRDGNNGDNVMTPSSGSRTSWPTASRRTRTASRR